jgi:hypothetical protein
VIEAGTKANQNGIHAVKNIINIQLCQIHENYENSF